MNPGDLKAIRTVLAENPAVVFAYLYGSSKEALVYNDIDIAVYSKEDSNPLSLSADLKIDLSENTGRPPDGFDVRVINHLLTKGDLFSLDDEKLIENIKTGLNDFDHFVGETEAYLTTQDSKL